MFKPKLPRQNQGFTLVEVLVAILITTVFVAVSMQAMVLAAVFKTRAQQYAEATTWIQEDLENVKYQAAQLKPATLTANAGATATQLQVSSVNGFAVGDTLIVGTDATNNVVSGVDQSTLTLTINSVLETDQLSGVAVISNKQCNPNSSTEGFAKALQDNLPNVPNFVSTSRPNVGRKAILGKNYELTRTPNIRNAEPYEILELNYKVVPQNALTNGIDDSIAKMYTEVIPNVALRCP